MIESSHTRKVCIRMNSLVLRIARSYTWHSRTCMEWIREAHNITPVCESSVHICRKLLQRECHAVTGIAWGCRIGLFMQRLSSFKAARSSSVDAKRVKWIFFLSSASALLLTIFAFQRSGRSVSAPRANREIGYAVCL